MTVPYLILPVVANMAKIGLIGAPCSGDPQAFVGTIRAHVGPNVGLICGPIWAGSPVEVAPISPTKIAKALIRGVGGEGSDTSNEPEIAPNKV